MNQIKEFITFNRMITVDLIKVIYSVGIAASGIILGVSVVSESLLMGIVVFIVFHIVWRLMSEWLIVVFAIHEKLNSIDKSLKRGDMQYAKGS